MNETAKYELREINAEDVSAITVILDKIGFEEMKPILISLFSEKEEDKEDEETEDKEMKLGLDVVGIILANYERCADSLFKWLADLASMEEQAVRKLSLADFTELLFAVIRKDEFKDFFTVVSKSLFK